MKKNKYISLGACVLLCGIATAESWASSEEDIQKNLNQLIATKQCPGCNLRGAALTRMDLREANLQGADLSNAKLSLTNLSQADLKNALLRNAVLGGTDFAGADLRGVDFTDAQLAGAYLKEALLDKELLRDTPSEPGAQALPEKEDEANEAETEELESISSEVEEPVDSESVSSDTITDRDTVQVAQAAEVAESPAQDVVVTDIEVPVIEEKVEPTELAEVTEIVSASSGEEEQEEHGEQEGVVAIPASAISEKAESLEGSEIVEVAGISATPESVALESLPDLQKEEKKKPPVALPDIERRVETTVRSKELAPLQEVQVEVVEEVVEVDAEVDEIPVIETGTEQKEDQPNKAVKKEPSLWNRMTSLFGSDSEDEKKGSVKKTKTVLREAQIEEQVGAYTVETFAQSQGRLRSVVATLLKERRCVACDLAGADLRGKDLEEVDLERADLSGAQLEDADLRAANLKGVNFIAANLKKADLRKADLYRADCTNADLTGARLEGAFLDSVDFTDAVGVQAQDLEKEMQEEQ